MQSKQEAATTQKPRFDPYNLEPRRVNPAERIPTSGLISVSQLVLEAQEVGEGPQVAGSQTSEEDIEGCQNMPPQNMPFFHKDYFELKELKKSAGAKRAF